VTKSGLQATTTFTVYVSSQSQVTSTTSCAVVIVAKWGDPSRTAVTSRGYNACGANAIQLQLERVLFVAY
jgi:hypothetical protein